MKKITALTVLLLFTVLTFGQDIKYVDTERLNIRENAGKQYNVVGQVNQGEKVTTISESNGWTEIETENGTKGFVASKYLSSDNQSKSSSNSKKESSWISILIGLGILGYAIYKVKNFFSGLFGSGNSSFSTKTSPRDTVRTSEKVPVPQKEKYYCKDCGQEFNSVHDLTFNSCFKSPTKKHELFEGQVGSKYYCKDCGQEFKSLKDLTFNSCFRSFTGKHQPYEGSIKAQYACKHCGQQFRTLKDLTFNSCFKSPTQKHQPAR